MAMRLPAGDHESERMLGARPDGRPVSARTVVLMPLKVDGKMSFFRGREVFGGAMVVVFSRGSGKLLEVGARALEERVVKWKLGAWEPIGVCEGQGSLSSDLEILRI